MFPVSAMSLSYLACNATRMPRPQISNGTNEKQIEEATHPQMIEMFVRLMELSQGTTANGTPIVAALRMNVMNTKDSAVAYNGRELSQYW